jgi:hypothetical protein
VLLENDSPIEASPSQLLIVEKNRALIVGFEPSDDSQQSRLPTATAADNAYELSGIDGQQNISQSHKGAFGTSKGLVRDLNVDRAALSETTVVHKFQSIRSASSVTKKPAADRVHRPVGRFAEDGEQDHAG